MNEYEFKKVTKLSPIFISVWYELWESSMYKNYFNSPYWVLACIKTYKENVIVYACYRNNDLLGVFPLVEKKFLFVYYLTFPGKDNMDKASFLFKEKEILNIFILYLSHKNILLREVQQEHLSLFSNFIILNKSVNPYSYLENDSILSKKTFKKLRKKLKAPFSFKAITGSSDQLMDYFNKAVILEGQSNKRDLGRSHFGSDVNVKLYKNIIRESPQSVCIFMLFDRDVIISYTICLTWGRVCMAYNTAYNSVYQNYSPGDVLMYKTSEWLRKNSYLEFDLSRGATTQKLKFAKRNREQFSIVFSNSIFVFSLVKIVVYLKQIFTYSKKILKYILSIQK